MIDPPDDRWSFSDTAFRMFLNTVNPADFSAYEWRLFRALRLEQERQYR